MTKTFFKLSTVSLITILSSMSIANAGRVNIVNIDVPPEVNGVKMSRTLSFMGTNPSSYTNIEVPPQGLNPGTKPLPDNTYSDIAFGFSPVDPYGNAPHLSVFCNEEDNGQKERVTIGPNTVLSLSVGYQPNEGPHGRVTCQIVHIGNK